MRTREDYLLREKRFLATYALRAADSRGRRHPEEEHPLRSPFERDRDRIIHSGAFRKLEYKTQVFVNFVGDYYRTRLTHTLEAAQISRSMARFLALNEDLAEAIALAHDVGHPPFGHAGEAALQEVMADHGGFEHNWQGLRVVDELECRYPGFPGLNLTWEVREGIAKHGPQFQKSGDVAEFAEFRETLHPSLEAQIVDVCDAIAYNAHDIDDGLTAGLITLSDLEEVPLWRELREGNDAIGVTPEQAKYQGVRAIINAQVDDLVRSIDQRLAAWSLQTADDVRRSPERVAEHSEAMAAKNAELRQFLRERVYEHYQVVRMSVKAQRILRDLFDTYQSHPEQLPPAQRERAEEIGLPRALCDYLSSLTDREASQEHGRLFNLDVTM